MSDGMGNRDCSLTRRRVKEGKFTTGGVDADGFHCVSEGALWLPLPSEEEDSPGIWGRHSTSRMGTRARRSERGGGGPRRVSDKDRSGSGDTKRRRRKKRRKRDVSFGDSTGRVYAGVRVPRDRARGRVRQLQW
ncbi:uncharacterized protein LOC112451783 isoform X1 [Temnothorax curvispinosus]|uniref:Uncharacterized protein LOC112451783 isoform X1 n=1 Tax=Temnothorax curvispinosus TaxID=300111 RepID=A0A6J1PD19_9HYME|nr:uncharacterized protein LOC112451783 isoform X1 [Temnothorax curvispinosus]